MSVKITSMSESPEAVKAALGEAGKNIEVVNVSPVVSRLDSLKGDEKPKDAGKSASDSEPTEPIEPAEMLEEDDVEEPEKIEAASEKPSKKQKQKASFQNRINELTKDRADAQKERDHWREQALKFQTQQEPEPKYEQKVEAAPKIDGKPIAANFNSHEEFVEALADWKFEQREAARAEKLRKEKLEKEQHDLVSSHVKRMNEFKSKTQDFETTVKAVEHIPMSIAVQQAILNSDESAALMYELARNPEEYSKICQMDFVRATKAVGRIEERIEGRLKAQKESQDSSTPQPKTTKAPDPISPVGGKSSQGKKRPSEAKSYREFIALTEQN